MEENTFGRNNTDEKNKIYYPRESKKGHHS